MSPHCPKCGKEVSPEARYCPFCGAVLKTDKAVLQEKIAEARHNEMISYISVFIGIALIFLATYVGSITETKYEYPFEITYRPFAYVAILFAVLGVLMMILSATIGIYYVYQRYKLMKQLESLKGEV